MDSTRLEQQIAAYGKPACAILGSPETSDYELINLQSCPPPPETQAALHARGLFYVGTMGLVNGRFVSAFETTLEPVVVKALIRAFVQFVERSKEN